MPAGLLGHSSIKVLVVTWSLSKGQSPFATDLFLLFGSTGSKQTLNGLFYLIADKIIQNDLIDFSPRSRALFSRP